VITGAEPAVVLLHGFPDDMHLYDWVLPDLTGRRRVITLDFLGWGTLTNRRVTPTPRTTPSRSPEVSGVGS
jgi:pimeloyl-ACP methyl ester carboxylesterase